ncbi:rod shape-determining protein RodA [Blattabacterium cuenoti]|uniref:rod shape-determining protein RodA n=1 Tax=Blattabacterium cuenoti TaxID=1653831 RepID=UPI00163C6326|nr:rod shape-determining protein RodA [Blattabacterium cuenoti]
MEKILLIRRRRNYINNIDWFIIIIYFIITFFGYINLYSVSIEKAEKQLIWIFISFISILIIFSFKPIYYKNFSILFFIITLLLLIGVFFFGKEINGSKSWYIIGPINFQPSELAKISTSLVIANLLNKYSLNNRKIFFIILLILILPSFLIFKQPDPGSSIIFSSFFLTLYREGLSIIFILYCIFFILLFILPLLKISYSIIISFLFLFLFIIFITKKKKKIFDYFYYIILFIIFSSFSVISPFILKKVLKPHHINRISILFQNEFDKKYRNDIGYNLLYSKTAIGSGKIFGKGFHKGTLTKGRFVPEQHTDYIFCTVGEEWGFLGSVILIIFYLLFIGRIYFLSEKQKDPFGRILGYSVGNIILIHFFINLGMAMGLFPTIGIVLPFFSYGGSSFLSFTILFFLFLRIDAFNQSNYRL